MVRIQIGVGVAAAVLALLLGGNVAVAHPHFTDDGRWDFGVEHEPSDTQTPQYDPDDRTEAERPEYPAEQARGDGLIPDYLNSLLPEEDSTFGPWMWLGLGVFAVLAGAVHALTPGHGKGVISAYILAGGGARRRDIVWLALGITLTHTAVVYLLGIALWWFDDSAQVDQLGSAFQYLAIAVVGLLGLRLLWRGYTHWQQFAHMHTHHHAQPGQRSNLLLAALSGGLTPCIEALALMVVAAAAGYIMLGFGLVLLFSIGLAMTIVVLGMALLAGRRRFESNKRAQRLTQAAPLISGSVLVGLAVVLALL